MLKCLYSGHYHLCIELHHERQIIWQQYYGVQSTFLDSFQEIRWPVCKFRGFYSIFRWCRMERNEIFNNKGEIRLMTYIKANTV